MYELNYFYISSICFSRFIYGLVSYGSSTFSRSARKSVDERECEGFPRDLWALFASPRASLTQLRFKRRFVLYPRQRRTRNQTE